MRENERAKAAAARQPVAMWLLAVASLALVAAWATTATVEFWAIGLLAGLGAAVVTFSSEGGGIGAADRRRDTGVAVDPGVITDESVFDLVVGRELLRARRYVRPVTAVSVALDVDAANAARADVDAVELANELVHSLRETDYVAHIERERLLLLLPETTLDAARGLTNRLLGALGADLVLRLRVGFAAFPDDDVTWVALRAYAVADERPVSAPVAGADGGDERPGTRGGGGGVTRRRRGRRAVVRAARASGSIARRTVDVAVVLAVAPVVAPLLLAVALLIKLETPGPVLVSHVRVGRGGKPIALLKLRTMVRDAEALKPQLAHLNMLAWPDFKIANDPRVTRVGRWLRRTSLDELPQLWNLLVGELTLIGPRPCSVGVDRYELWQTERLEAAPGLFGQWQAEGRGTATFDQRCRMDIRQVRERSLAEDLRLAAASMKSVVAGRGAA
jgi:lipopolysaccharide/colanic/teichoic acid biosynthesis glycosyltransferase